MVAFLYRMGAGIAGAVNRVGLASVEPQVLMSGSAPTAYGTGVVMDATGYIRAPVAGDPPATGPQAGGMAYGLYVRPYPTQSSQDPLGTSTPPTSGPASILVRGYMTVQLHGAVAAAKGAPAYIWKAAAAGGQVPGGVTADGSTLASVLAIRGYFMGPADANGITELAFNI